MTLALTRARAHVAAARLELENITTADIAPGSASADARPEHEAKFARELELGVVEALVAIAEALEVISRR